MKRIALFTIAAIMAFSASARAPKSLFPFAVEDGVVVSHPDNKMSHGSSAIITKSGDVYISHLRDYQNNHEDPSMLTIEIAMSKFNAKQWKNPKITHTTVVKTGGTIGSFKQQDNFAPYDNFLLDLGDKVRGIFMGYENDNSVMVAFDIDPKTCQPASDIMRCHINYTVNGVKKRIPISANAFKEAYADLGVTDFAGYERPLIDKKFIKHGEWYYNVISSWCTRHSVPIIVRTKDGIDFEVVFTCPEFKFGAAEGAVTIKDDRIYVIARTSRPKEKIQQGTFLGVYSLSTGECLRKPYHIGDIESRPDMITFNDTVYVMYNVKPNYLLENGKSANRSRIRLAILNEMGTVERAWEIASPHSIQYYCLNEYKGDVYLTFGEDRFNRARAKKGNISFVKTNL